MPKNITQADKALHNYFESKHAEAAGQDWGKDLKDQVLKLKRPKRIYEILVPGIVGAGLVTGIALYTAREDPNAPPMMLESSEMQAARGQNIR